MRRVSVLVGRVLGKTARRVVLAILLTATIPLVVQLLVGRAFIARISATAFQPEFGEHLSQSLGVYADLAQALKQGMRSEAEVVAMSLAQPSEGRDDEARIDALLGAHPRVVSLAIGPSDEPATMRRERAEPVDLKAYRTFTVTTPLGGEPTARELTAVFAAPRARFEEMEGMQQFEQAYRQLEQDHRREYLDQTYSRVFLLILAATIGLAILAGVWVVRPVTRRIERLAEATGPVASGDPKARFPEEGDDEVGELGRAFNRMLGELEQSRVRIEFLRTMSDWQKVARRLAHEIKNPLTPIMLAVEECHRRYPGDDPNYTRIVDTTLEVVSEEVSSLRRLVREFSDFARLPRAELERADLGEFLREQRPLLEAASSIEGASDRHLELTVEPGEMIAWIDREMLSRALKNLVRNAAESLRDAHVPAPRIDVRCGRGAGGYALAVEDNGPGIAPAIAAQVFTPYATTKRDGTGLGLSIVKKIVVDHGGSVEVAASRLGGACFRVTIPLADSPAAKAAREPSADEPLAINAEVE